MQEPDPQVVAAARGGDLRAFESLVRRYQSDVYRFILHLLADPSLAEDVAQETFVRAFRFLRRYRGESRFTTWLFSIARNCVVDELRRTRRHKRLAERMRATHLPAETGERLSGPEVREALATLPFDLLEPIVLIDVFGLSYAEVAKLTKSPAGTVKSRVHRARMELVRLLGPSAEESAGEG